MSVREYQYYEEVKKRTVVSEPVYLYNLGGHNELVVQPNVMVQSMTRHSDSLALAASGSQVIQIIKLNTDNIKKMRFMASITTATSSVYETFDYTNNTTLRAVWATNLASRVQSYNDKAVVSTGTSSMRISTENNAAATYYIQKDLGTATDFSSAVYNKLTLNVRKNTTSLIIALRFVDADGLSAYTLLGVSGVNTWTTVEKTHNSFTSDQATSTDWTRIRYIRFVVMSNTATNQSFWADQMVFFNAATANNLTISLYNCGATEPTTSSTISDWTVITSDQGNTAQNQTASILDEVGHTTLEINDTFGCQYGSTPLTVGNYVAVVFNWVADSLIIAGHTSATQPYLNGKCFTSLDSGATLTEASGTSIRFTLYSVVDCKLRGYKLCCNSAPKASTISFHYDDHCKNLENLTLRAVLSDVLIYEQDNIELDYEKDNQLIFYVKHDNTSSFLYGNVLLDIEYTKSWE